MSGDMIKLKDSCAACAISKVKCNKVKSGCKRCVRKGVDCIYEPSCRAGRHARRVGPSQEMIFVPTFTSTSLASEQVAWADDRRAPAASATDTIFNSPVYATDMDPMLPVGQAFAAADIAWDEFLTPPVSSPTSPGAVPSSQFPMSPPLLDKTTFDWSSQGNEANVRGQFCQTSSRHDPVMISDVMLCEWPGRQAENCVSDIPEDRATETLRLWLHGGPKTSQDRSRDCCLAKIVGMLEIPLPGHLVHPPTPMTSGDDGSGKLFALQDVITVSKAMISDLSSMLDCTCLLDDFVASLMPLVVQRIMMWYDVATQRLTTQSASTLFQKCGRNIAAMSGKDSIKASLCRATTLEEDYVLNVSEQRQVAASLVLGGLHRVQSFIGLLSGLPQASSTDTDINRDTLQHGTTLSKAMSWRLLTDLRESVHFTVNQILVLLRAEQLGETIALLPEFYSSVWT